MKSVSYSCPPRLPRSSCVRHRATAARRRGKAIGGMTDRYSHPIRVVDARMIQTPLTPDPSPAGSASARNAASSGSMKPGRVRSFARNCSNRPGNDPFTTARLTCHIRWTRHGCRSPAAWARALSHRLAHEGIVGVATPETDPDRAVAAYLDGSLAVLPSGPHGHGHGGRPSPSRHRRRAERLSPASPEQVRVFASLPRQWRILAQQIDARDVGAAYQRRQIPTDALSPRAFA